MRSRLWILATCACLMLLALGGWMLVYPGPRVGVTKANFDRIDTGIKVEDVEAIFGEPGVPDLMSSFRGIPPTKLNWYADDNSRATIWFSDGRVTQTRWLDSNETLYEKVRRWLRF